MTDWKNPPRLFIPGPVKINEDVLQQLARPTLGHRGKEYSQLHGETVDMLKKIFFTEQRRNRIKVASDKRFNVITQSMDFSNTTIIGLEF